MTDAQSSDALDHPHDEHADRTREVTEYPECERRHCMNDGIYVFDVLHSEPVYCAIHLAAPPYHDLTFTRLVKQEEMQ